MTYRELGNLIACLDEDSKELIVYFYGSNYKAERDFFTSKFPDEFHNIMYKPVFPRS